MLKLNPVLNYMNRLQRYFKILLGLSLILLSVVRVRAQVTPSNNIISVDVSTMPQNASFDYNACFALGKDLGMRSVGLHQSWTALEIAPNTFNFTILDIANAYYPAYNMPIDLNIDPIETNVLEVPSDLKSVAFDNANFIKRFKTLLDSVKVHIPNTSNISSLVIGSEIDIYLGSNNQQWQRYTTFYNAVADYARTLWPGVKVAVELTYDGLSNFNTQAQTLNAKSDIIGVSHYPLNSNFKVKPVSAVEDVFSNVSKLYPSKPIYFYQFGYPSSKVCGSSEIMQRQFITQTFKSWDTYANNIKMVDFTWLHDLDTAAVRRNGQYYGIKDSSFLEFLRTLGLRTWNGNGQNKAAFFELQCEAKYRGFNKLPILCTGGTNEKLSPEISIEIEPNPSSFQLNVKLDKPIIGADVLIYNSYGQLINRQSLLANTSFRIETSTYKSGVYRLVIANKDLRINKSFMVMH